MTIERLPITSDAHPYRDGLVTAGDMPCLFGFSPYKTIGELHAEKSGIWTPPQRNESVMLRRGKALERVAADEFAKLHPDWKIEKAHVFLRDQAHQIGATPDFFIETPDGRRGVLQTKVVAASIFKRFWTEDERVPPYWALIQTFTEMMLAEADFGIVAALVIGDFAFELKEYDEVLPHANTQARILDAVTDFWKHVESGEQPTIDYERDRALLAIMYPSEVPGKEVDLRGDNRILELLDERENVLGGLHVAEDRLACIDTEIKSKIGDAEIAIVPGWRVSWRQQTRKAHSVKEAIFRVLRAKRENRGQDK